MPRALIEGFSGPLNPRLQLLLLGAGTANPAPGPGDGSALRLTIPASRTYADAQLDDYRASPRSRFPWTPPVRLSLDARASHAAPVGTLGFGFWNDPFTLSLGQGGATRRLPAAPNAAWFFSASPPNQMELVPGVPGHGWKAATLNAGNPPALLLAPVAAVVAPLSLVPGLGKLIMAAGRKAVRASERLLDSGLTDWHRYEIVWEQDRVQFRVDSQGVHESISSPSGRLGFVAWIDNQYAVASRTGRFGFGVIPTEREGWLELANLAIVPL